MKETAPFYRLSAAEVRRIIAEVQDAVAGWRELAPEVGLRADEVDLVARDLRALTR